MDAASPSTGQLPAELLSNEPGSFAYSVMRERNPALIQQLCGLHPYDAEQIAALDTLVEEMAAGPMRPLDAAEPDHAVWQQWGDGYFGQPWAEAPFLWAESYFYRRILQAVGYFRPGPWMLTDPFGPLKTAELHSADLATDLRKLDDLAALPLHEQAQAKLLASLWGNKADLGFLVGKASDGLRPGIGAGLVADQSDDLWSLLYTGSGHKICFIADNVGRELVADLVLIDHLLNAGLASQVTLHVKPHPYYVSDAVTGDVLATLKRLAAGSGEAVEVTDRLWTSLEDGSLIIYTNGFYAAPWDYRHLPPDLRLEYCSASLILLKGDLNYRRLVGDRAWQPTIPFELSTGYFAGPLATLRTLKSEVITGVTPTTFERLSASDEAWRINGSRALIQVRL